MRLTTTGLLSLTIMLFSLGHATAGTVSLASAMDDTGYISEDAITGSFARINMGNGSLGSAGALTGDADGVYALTAINDDPAPSSPLGSIIDMFPREANFLVGEITYNDLAITGSGVETTPITSIDLGGFWTTDPNRTSSVPGNAPTVVSDISDHAIGLWFFNGSGGIGFGALDAVDIVTFTNGVLTSIDLELTTSFDIGTSLGTLNYSGTFSVVGNEISYQIDNTISTVVGPSTMVVDLNGTVNAVSAVPEPTTGLLVTLALIASPMLGRRQ